MHRVVLPVSLSQYHVTYLPVTSQAHGRLSKPTRLHLPTSLPCCHALDNLSVLPARALRYGKTLNYRRESGQNRKRRGALCRQPARGREVLGTKAYA